MDRDVTVESLRPSVPIRLDLADRLDHIASRLACPCRDSEELRKNKTINTKKNQTQIKNIDK